jgi:hypothetical protein
MEGQNISYNSFPCCACLYTVTHCTYHVHIYLLLSAGKRIIPTVSIHVNDSCHITDQAL